MRIYVSGLLESLSPQGHARDGKTLESTNAFTMLNICTMSVDVSDKDCLKVTVVMCAHWSCEWAARVNISAEREVSAI